MNQSVTSIRRGNSYLLAYQINGHLKSATRGQRNDQRVSWRAGHRRRGRAGGCTRRPTQRGRPSPASTSIRAALSASPTASPRTARLDDESSRLGRLGETGRAPWFRKSQLGVLRAGGKLREGCLSTYESETELSDVRHSLFGHCEPKLVVRAWRCVGFRGARIRFI